MTTSDINASDTGSLDTVGTNSPEWSVTEISQRLKKTVEDAYGHIRVRGEVSRPARPGSGHLYFTLKDERNTLSAVCWRGVAQKLSVTLEEGADVVCTGRLTTYGPRSNYQLVVEDIRLAGIGALLQIIEERRKRLAAEGLFDESRKRSLPYLPRRIGLVTSPTGAVIRDILHRLEERCPCAISLWPVRVQGAGAAAEIAAAIKGLGELGSAEDESAALAPDLIIVARGGGSVEDLAAFNEEDVVRAAAASRVPLISAVGHETDTTLIDFAADLRAPTPTAAAEYAVPVRSELLSRLSELENRRHAAIQRKHFDVQTRLDEASRRLGHPERLLEMPRQRLDELSVRHDRALGLGLDQRNLRLSLIAERLTTARLSAKVEAGRTELNRQTEHLKTVMQNILSRKIAELDTASSILESLSYKNVLSRGFALVYADDGTVIQSKATPKSGDGLSIQFSDGALKAVVGTGKSARKPRSDSHDLLNLMEDEMKME